MKRLLITIIISISFINLFADGYVRIVGQNLENYLVGHRNHSNAEASTVAELESKTGKIVNAFRSMDADIYAMAELEKADTALVYLTQAMNAAAGGDVYAYVQDNIVDCNSNSYSYGAIMVGFIYKKATIDTVGRPQAMADDDTYGPRMQAQVFKHKGSNEMFVLSMNHFKASSGSSNVAKRLANAQTLVSNLSRLTTIDPDVLVMGDLNCETGESAIQYLIGQGFAELTEFFDSTAYSYVYQGSYELIDHALGNACLSGQVTSVGVCHINTGNSQRFSDHDAVMVELNLGPRASLLVQATHGRTSGSGIYLRNTPVEISVNPDLGYHFSQWSDGITANPRTVLAVQDSVFTAVLEPDTIQVSVNTSSIVAGSVYGDTLAAFGDSVVIGAIPNIGYHFTQWSDSCTENPRTIVVGQDSSYTAMFDRISYQISALAYVGGKATGSGSYYYLDTATISATANYGYHFAQWSDGNTANPRSLIVDRDSSLIAIFGRESFLISTAVNDEEKGFVSGDTLAFYEEQVVITATANYGYHFSRWSDGNTTNPRTITVIENKTYTALFEKNQYTIAVNVADESEGSVAGGATVDYLDQLQISAAANFGYHFSQWSDGNTDNPRTIVVTSDSSITAMFDRDIFTITVLSADDTKGSAEGSVSAEYLSITVISASATHGYRFYQWQDGNTENPRTVTISGDMVYSAYFTLDQFELVLTVNDETMGVVTGAGLYDYKSMVECKAIPVSGYEFVKWSDGNTYNPYTFILMDNVSLEAVFQKIQSAVYDVEASPSAEKFFRDGILYIRRGEHLYDVTGRLVE